MRLPSRSSTRWFTRTTLVGAILLTAACAPAQGTAHPIPQVCSDSVYARLHRQPPDSLSAREWERLRLLDAACTRSRSSGGDAGMGMMGMGGGAGRVGVILVPLIIVAMVATMLIGGF